MTTTTTSPMQRVDTWQIHGERRWTRLLIQTAHSRYELQALADACVMVLIRGGRHFLEPRPVLVAGARHSCSDVLPGTIRVGLPLELHEAGLVIRTSPVREIEIQTA